MVHRIQKQFLRFYLHKALLQTKVPLILCEKFLLLARMELYGERRGEIFGCGEYGVHKCLSIPMFECPRRATARCQVLNIHEICSSQTGKINVYALVEP